MATILGIVVVIGGVIFFHELGHFVFAKLNGMRVETFSIGFPPRLIGKKLGETDYCISAIPLGGYVKVTGVIDESMDTEGASNTEPYSFSSKNAFQKSLFITGGVIFNFLLAVIVFSFLAGQSGSWEAKPDPVVNTVVPEYPAALAGIEAGDRIVSVNGIETDSWDAMTTVIHSNPETEITVTYQRGDITETVTLTTTLTKQMEGWSFVDVGIIGISPEMEQKKLGFFGSIGQGIDQTGYWLRVTVVSLKSVVTGEESVKNIGGPIMIAQLAGESAKSGLRSLFALMAVISVNLGLINILPVPALDGGHLVVTITEAIMRHPLSIKAKLRIQQVGLALILMLTVLVLFNDITRWIGG